MNYFWDLTYEEMQRQRLTLNLIASENYPSPAVLELLGSIWSIKYAEGYPGKRYYAGNQYIDELERQVQDLALQVFAPDGGYGVNVQVLSGSPANAMVYLAMLQPGDVILSLTLANGGHLSHLHDTSNWRKFFKHVTYDVHEVEPGCWEIDDASFIKALEQHRPKLTIIGFSAYPRAYSFERMCQIAHEYGSLVLADIAHINGLVATGEHDSPFRSGVGGADFVTMTTHKTLRGPRSAMVFARDEYMELINRTVFPGTSGGPHIHQIAAVGQCLAEVVGLEEYPDGRTFTDYTKSIISTCKALEQGLSRGGLEIVSPTQNHLCLAKLPDDIDSLAVQQKLETCGVILNRNQIPFDKKTPWRPSGLRLGTAALASRGLTDKQAYALGEMIAGYILGAVAESTLTEFSSSLAHELNWWYQ